jgi:hypothetical protein
MSALRYLVPIILLGLIIILVNYYTKPSFTMTSVTSSKLSVSNSPVQYGLPFTIAAGVNP